MDTDRTETGTVMRQKTTCKTSDNNELQPAESSGDCPSFKLVIVGDSKVGKTKFMKRLLTGEFNKKYEPTNRIEISKLQFYTNFGKIQFDCWDTSGDEKLGSLRDGSCIHGHCAIIVFDVSASLTYNHVSAWYQDICRLCENIPVVLCGNKVDVKDRKVKAMQVLFDRKKNLQYYEISTKNNRNLEKPFLYLARRLLGNSNLHFVKEPAFVPPYMQVDMVEQYEKKEL